MIFPPEIEELIREYLVGPMSIIMTIPEDNSYPFRICICSFCRLRHYRILSTKNVLTVHTCDNCMPILWDQYQVCGKCLVRVDESDDYQCKCHNSWTPAEMKAVENRILIDREVDVIAGKMCSPKVLGK